MRAHLSQRLLRRPITKNANTTSQNANGMPHISRSLQGVVGRAFGPYRRVRYEPELGAQARSMSSAAFLSMSATFLMRGSSGPRLHACVKVTLARRANAFCT